MRMGEEKNKGSLDDYEEEKDLLHTSFFDAILSRVPKVQSSVDHKSPLTKLGQSSKGRVRACPGLFVPTQVP